MKQILSLLLCAALSLSFVACGKPATNRAAASDGSASASGSISEQADVSAPAAVPTVTVTPTEASEYAEDGGFLLDCAYDKPEISMADEKIQKAIQQDLDAAITTFLLTRDYYIDLSCDEYSRFSSGEESTWFPTDEDGNYLPYYLHLTVTPTRVDQKVISILLNTSTYTHGAHGMNNIYALNYDTETGERLTFDALGENFRSTAMELVLARADEIAAEGIANDGQSPFFDDYAENIQTVVLDGTEPASVAWGIESEEPCDTATYYLTSKNVVFVSNQYNLQPFASGVIEFEIPYESFGEALNPHYLP